MAYAVRHQAPEVTEPAGGLKGVRVREEQELRGRLLLRVDAHRQQREAGLIEDVKGERHL